ncbi:Coenzyme A biosynthesis bifunctional protein CoaBC [Zhongshania aliphaticivorans]|uniref:Coenzyme A biosynthesis bifunctional protein CoaBC n=1 Tax=Zhongshania aliphaticivorans TaxID=1470434 RepID=A0A5S9PFU1_9GAMM|nr:bifunctional phosphopantothenoylcysteine decarboxylase/phosphopantothenate--cysteine ligase CoaBC [Zhongshania aliphaticivorans]CAA0102619.1 Coenzyme A biosynthesis bifunctional protein CoaBC [Zhongshania aliphaticivorans]CAA0114058.1 Coenzyme A biosynthesis bifunctional protein CoaBC [Zhongshania aliphaticivorans]
MKQLSNRHILLGVTGGIAAYKSAELIRRLKDHGADVRVVMTSAAMEFITPLTLQALSGNPVNTTLLDPEAEAGMGHIELARWADLIFVAPASADFMARLANGRGDDLLTTLCLATSAPVALAPAMNHGMWRDPATQANAKVLIERNISLFGPAAGAQACGDIGPGRMLEAEELAAHAASVFKTRRLDGIQLTITAGPTREAIDPVRYISNHSSGKMGYALASAAADAGAIVTLISGPTNLACPERVTRIDVTSAQDMLEAATSTLDHCQLFIGCAAVADYRPAIAADQKIKKDNDTMHIELVRNPDIVSTVANHAKRPITIGFAAETQDLLRYARGKLERKNLDLIIANDVSNTDIGFNSSENAVTAIWQEGQHTIPQMSKSQLAAQLINLIAEKFFAAKS